MVWCIAALTRSVKSAQRKVCEICELGNPTVNEMYSHVVEVTTYLKACVTHRCSTQANSMKAIIPLHGTVTQCVHREARGELDTKSAAFFAPSSWCLKNSIFTYFTEIVPVFVGCGPHDTSFQALPAKSLPPSVYRAGLLFFLRYYIFSQKMLMTLKTSAEVVLFPEKFQLHLISGRRKHKWQKLSIL